MSRAKRLGMIVGVAALTLVCSARGNAAASAAGAPMPLPAAEAATVTTTTTATDAQPATPAAKGSPLGLQPVAARTLAAGRGGADVFNDMQLKGVVADNQAINVSTGHNAITGGAFANASGVPMVVQNSGNNVLIQNATIINLQVK